MSNNFFVSRTDRIKGMPFIFVTKEELSGERVDELCEVYFEQHHDATLHGQALLVDLRGAKPKFEVVSKDWLPEQA
jgi:hypothetical protein